MKSRKLKALKFLGNFDRTNPRKVMVKNLDRLTSYEGTALEEWP
jgi:hypothetical protein